MKFFTQASILSVLLFNLSACGVLKSYFPDKEKDYQFSSELPPLKIPDEILKKGLNTAQPSKPLAEDREAVAVIGDVVIEAASKKDQPVAEKMPESDEVAEQKVAPAHLELVKFANGETRLQINKSVAMSWRMVGKALTAKGIEIVARDQANGEFMVQYDPNESDFKDESFFDELDFVFGEDRSLEKPYNIKLLARDKMTEVVILTGQDKPLSDGSDVSLLKLLLTTIQTDLSEE
jgi:outer membrane protein assembly factor BamC